MNIFFHLSYTSKLINEHINSIYSGALRVLGFIKRTCSALYNQKCLVSFYNALVRLILKF